MQMRPALVLVALLITRACLGQTNTTETICDTIVFGRHFTCCIAEVDGHVTAFGNRNDKGERHGWWCEVRLDSASSVMTEYHDGLKVHDRWRKGEVWRVDENGNVISKGKADRRAKKTF